MNESFNAEAVSRALKNAAAGIDEACTAFNAERERVTNQLNQSGVALGGNLGRVALQTFEAENEAAFENLKRNMNSFMSRSEQIAKNSTSTEDATQGIYAERI